MLEKPFMAFVGINQACSLPIRSILVMILSIVRKNIYIYRKQSVYMVAKAYNPRWKQEGHKFKFILGYITSSRVAWAT